MVLFPKAVEFDLGDSDTVAFLVVTATMSVALVSVSGKHVCVTPRELVYTGILRTVRVAWQDVRRVHGNPYHTRLDLWTRDRHLFVDWCFSRHIELEKAILDRVRECAPNAVIEVSRRAFFWR